MIDIKPLITVAPWMSAMITGETVAGLAESGDWRKVLTDLQELFECHSDPMIDLAHIAARDTKDGHGRHRFSLASMSNSYTTSMQDGDAYQTAGMQKFDSELRRRVCPLWTLEQALAVVQLAFTAPILARFTNAAVGYTLGRLRRMKSPSAVRAAIDMRTRHEFENEAVERHVMWSVGDVLTAGVLNRIVEEERGGQCESTPLLDVLRAFGEAQQFTDEIVRQTRGDPRCKAALAMMRIN